MLSALELLSHAPGYCPFTGCHLLVFPTEFMLHMLKFHSENRVGFVEIRVHDVYECEPLLLKCNLSCLEFGKNVCLNVLCFGGERDRPETQPARQNLCIPNTCLLQTQSRYVDYLGIGVNVCKTSFTSLLHHKKLREKITDPNKSEQIIYAIWCVGRSTTRRVYVTMTVHDHKYTRSVSAIRTVRDYCKSQAVSKFLRNDSNYLLLTNNDVEACSDGPDNTLNLEIIVHVKPTVTDPQANAPHLDDMDCNVID